jgi:LPXTG-site transpeptidase (sortase) family protein
MRRVSPAIAIAVVGLIFATPSPAARLSPHDTISIPKIGVTAKIGTRLSRGAIYWNRVGRPGEGTTIAIAAHDITPVRGFHGHGPFHDINRLATGDKITVTHAGRRYAYRVTGRRVIASSNLHMADLTRYERLLLTTCWPRGSSKYRLVVYAQPAKG